jgi:tetrahydromethanopterin S-methyltransferase subunit B
MLEVLQAGLPPEETAEALSRARESIRSNTKPQPYREETAVIAETKQIPPNEQIEWAAAYVEDRLDELLKQLEASIETLDFIVEETNELPDRAGVQREAGARFAPGSVVVLLDKEELRKSGRDEVVSARENFSSLRTALKEWTGQS